MNEIKNIFRLIDRDENSEYSILQFENEVDECELNNFVDNVKWDCFDNLLKKIEKKFGKFEIIDIPHIYY